MNTLLFEAIKKEMASIGADEDKRPYRVNIAGYRSTLVSTNTFDDYFFYWRYNDKGEIEVMQVDGTTDPGHYYLINPINKQGAAVIATGFHYKCWGKGLHKGKRALVQVGDLKIYRDNDKDLRLDYSNLQTAISSCGLNHHDSGESDADDKKISRYSAGCQVVEKGSDYDKMWEWIEKDYKLYKEDWSYFLSDCNTIKKPVVKIERPTIPVVVEEKVIKTEPVKVDNKEPIKTEPVKIEKPQESFKKKASFKR